MDQVINYYRSQATENLKNQSMYFDSTSTYSTKQFDYLTFDDTADSFVNRGNTASNISNSNGNQVNIAYEILLLFLHYLIAFPVFLLCWIALISYLKRRGHINRSEADSMLDELKNVKIAMPSTTSTAFSPSSIIGGK